MSISRRSPASDRRKIIGAGRGAADRGEYIAKLPGLFPIFLVVQAQPNPIQITLFCAWSAPVAHTPYWQFL
jgi:hypothetical protein